MALLLALLGLLAFGAALIPSFGVAQLAALLVAGGVLAVALGRRRHQPAGSPGRRLSTFAAAVATGALVFNLTALLTCQLRSWGDDELQREQWERDRIEQQFRRAVGAALPPQG